MSEQDRFIWVPFYRELAEKLRVYKTNRDELIEIIKNIYKSIDMPLPKLDKDNQFIDVDPFTVFALFNKSG